MTWQTNVSRCHREQAVNTSNNILIEHLNLVHCSSKIYVVHYDIIKFPAFCWTKHHFRKSEKRCCFLYTNWQQISCELLDSLPEECRVCEPRVAGTVCWTPPLPAAGLQPCNIQYCLGNKPVYNTEISDSSSPGPNFPKKIIPLLVG